MTKLPRPEVEPTPPMADSPAKPVGQGIVGGAAWMIVARIADRVIGLVSTLILARVLTPADFGLVAMAMAVIGLIELASAFGFEVALVRAKDPSREMYDTVWTLNLAFGLGCALVTALAALPAAALYRDDRLFAVMLVLALSWAIASTGNIGTVDFRRNLDFAREFKWLISARLAGFAVTIPAALLLQSYWALIAGTLTTRIVSVLLSYAWHPFRPRLCLRAARALFNFSIWIFLERIANFGNARSADFVIGRTHGPAELGIYRLGEEIGYLPGSELVAPINRALLPGMSRMVEGGQSIIGLVVSATGVVATFLVPACLGLAALADPVVRTLLGAKWTAAVPIVQIMALNALFVALWSNQSIALYSAGLPKLPGAVAMGRLVIFVPCMAVLAPTMGGRGVALAALASSALAIAAGIGLSLRRLSIPARQYLAAIWRPVVAGVVLYLAARGAVTVLGAGADWLGTVASLAVGAAAGGAAYVACLAALFVLAGRPAGAEQHVIGYLRSRRRKPDE